MFRSRGCLDFIQHNSPRFKKGQFGSNGDERGLTKPALVTLLVSDAIDQQFIAKVVSPEPFGLAILMTFFTGLKFKQRGPIIRK